MGELPAVVLRSGVIAGLGMTAVGILISRLFGISNAELWGLWVVVLTPITALITIGVVLAKKRDYLGVLAVVAMIAAIIISAVSSLR